MQSIKFQYDVVHKFDSPANDVVDFFHDIKNLALCTADLESFQQIDESMALWTLKTKRDMGLVFQPVYQLSYEWVTPRTLLWQSVPSEGGNINIDARIQFTASTPTTTRVSIIENVEFVLPVSFITSKIIKVIASREAAADMQGFFRRIDSRLSESCFTVPSE